MMEVGQSKLEGWFLIEIMGHNKACGFVTTEYYGSVCLFRVDAPEIPESERILKRPEYMEIGDEVKMWPAGTVVRRAALPAHTELVAPSAIFRVHPCTEEAARETIKDMYPRALILVNLPKSTPLIESAADVTCDCQDRDCPHHTDDADGCERPAIGSETGTKYVSQCGPCSSYHEAEDIPF